MKCCFITFITIQLHLVLVTSGYSQTQLLDQKVTLVFEDISFKSLLEHLRHAYDISITYSADHIPLHQKVEIEAFNLPLGILFDRLCNITGLSYAVIDNHIVLRDKPTVERSSKYPRGELSETTEKQNFSPMFKTGRDSSQIKTIDPKGKFFIGDVDTVGIVMDKVALTARFLSGPVVRERDIEGEKTRKGMDLSLGVLASYDYYDYNFKERPNTNQEYCPEKNFTIGIVGVLGPNQEFSASIGVLFSTNSYRLDYNYKLANLEDPFPFPERTTVCLSYTEFPVDIDYRIFRSGRLSLYLSTGITVEILTHKEEHTTFLNAEEKATAHFVRDNKKFLWGGALGIKFWYNLSKPIRVFFIPDFTHYFTPLNEVIMKSNPQILKFKMGVTLNIKAMN